LITLALHQPARRLTHCRSGENFPVSAIRASWATTPPIAVAKGGSKPWAVSENWETKTRSTCSTYNGKRDGG